MRRVLGLALVSLALIAIAAALNFRVTSAPAVVTPLDAPHASVATKTAPPTPAELERSVAPATLTQPRSDDSHLFGLVVDGQGAPLADARVWVFALDGRWAAGVTPPEIRVRGGPVAAFETHTRADGRFELRTPVPSGLRLRMEVESADHRGHISRDLRASAESNAKSIVAGENDFGKLVVPLRSAITGRVVARGGTPLGGASVGATAIHGDSLAATTVTELDGTFALASVPAGEYALSASASRHVNNALELKLAPDRVLADVEITLDPTPTLAGRVLDLDGNPLAGVTVFASRDGRHEGNWRGSGTTPEGRFELTLDEVAPHALWTRSSVHEPWDSRLIGLPDFAPGTRDIEIRLAKLTTTRVHVVDSETRLPLAVCSVAGFEDIAQRIGNGMNAAHIRPGELTSGDLPSARLQPPEGVLVALATPPQRVVLSAPGHKSVVETLSARAEQTFALAPLGAVRGKIANGGARRVDEAVLLVPAELALAAYDSSGERQVEHSGDGPSFACLALAPSVRHSILAPDWSFEIRGVLNGTYTLYALVEGAPLVTEDKDGQRWESPTGLQAHRLRTNVLVRVGETTDVGVLELPLLRASARIDVLTPARADRGLLRTLLTASVNGVRVPVDRPSADRPWLLDALPLGELEVRFADHAPLLGPKSWSSELVASRLNVLVVDLGDFDPCAVSIAAASLPEETTSVQLRLADGSAAQTMPAYALEQRTTFLARAGAIVIAEAHDALFDWVHSSSSFVEVRERSFKVLRVTDAITLPSARTFEVVFP